MNLMTMNAVAYIYSGDWVADCPAGCANVEFLFMATRPGGPKLVRKPMFQCSNCGAQAEITWPRRQEELLEVLMKRPNPGNRNWYPKDHETAVRFRIAHGQSVEDLREENVEHGVTP